MKSLLYLDNSLEIYLEYEEEKLLEGKTIYSNITLYTKEDLKNKISLEITPKDTFDFNELIKKTSGDYKTNKLNKLELSLKGIEMLLDMDFIKEKIEEKNKTYKISIYTAKNPINPYFRDVE